MSIKITDINICCDATLDENPINDTGYQKWLEEEHQDFNYEDIGIQSNLEMTDESSWLLEEIEKIKETDKLLYSTLLDWVKICNEYNLLTEVSYLTKSFYKENSNLRRSMDSAMYEWDL